MQKLEEMHDLASLALHRALHHGFLTRPPSQDENPTSIREGASLPLSLSTLHETSGTERIQKALWLSKEFFGMKSYENDWEQPRAPFTGQLRHEEQKNCFLELIPSFPFKSTRELEAQSRITGDPILPPRLRLCSITDSYKEMELGHMIPTSKKGLRFRHAFERTVRVDVFPFAEEFCLHRTFTKKSKLLFQLVSQESRTSPETVTRMMGDKPFGGEAHVWPMEPDQKTQNPNSNLPKKVTTHDQNVRPSIEFMFQSRNVFSDPEQPLHRFRFCLSYNLRTTPTHASLNGPIENPDFVKKKESLRFLFLRIDEFHIFLYEPTTQTMRKVLNCGPLGTPVVLSEVNPTSFFECTVTSSDTSPIVRGLAKITAWFGAGGNSEAFAPNSYSCTTIFSNHPQMKKVKQKEWLPQKQSCFCGVGPIQTSLRQKVYPVPIEGLDW